MPSWPLTLALSAMEAEVWSTTPFGAIGLGADTGPAFVGRDTWDRHAHKLAPLKVSWGIA